MARERRILVPLNFHVVLPGGTGAADLITNVPLRGNGTVVAWSYTADVAATGTSASRSFNLEIGTVDITGSAATMVLTDADAAGETKALGVPTGANTYKDGDTLSMESPSAGAVAFTAGQGTVTIWLEVEVKGI